MAKGIARLGILSALLLVTQGAGAVTAGGLPTGEIFVNPADSRDEWFGLFKPAGEPVDLHDNTIGNDGSDRHRIDTDLLIVPAHFLALAGIWRSAVTASKVRTSISPPPNPRYRSNAIIQYSDGGTT